VARVLALVPDLLFGSRVQADLTAAGNEVALIGDEARLRERLTDIGGETRDGDEARADSGTSPVAVLVVDLTDARLDGSAILQALAADGLLAGVRTLAFFSHVDTAVGERARAAGFDLVVPRSRMAREGVQLVARLAAGD
jgi:DNA-binding NarL/FixJ family response regulator